MIYIGECPKCGTINAACFQYDAEFIADMAKSGLIVKKVDVERISVKHCEHFRLLLNDGLIQDFKVVSLNYVVYAKCQ